MTSPTDFLSTPEQDALGAVLLGLDDPEMNWYWDFEKRLERWVEQATEEQLHELIPLARQMTPPPDHYRLLLAYSNRGIPNLDDLEAYTNERGTEEDIYWIGEYRKEAEASPNLSTN